MHGAKSPAKTDWAPVNARPVTIWPDHDQPGADFARSVAKLADEAGASAAAIVDVPAGFPDAWDLADLPPADWTIERLRELLDAASLWQPTPEPAAGRRRRSNSAWGDEGEAAQHEQQKEASSLPTTEDAIALRFAEAHANTLRHVAMWSRWLRWEGKRWSTDETLSVFDLVRRQCREARKALPADASEKLHAILASARTVAAVERLAKSDRRLAATVDQWDQDPDLLNTPSGLIDLRTGAIRPHASADYCTKITAVAPAPPGTDCPLWRAFLDRIMAGDQELIGFLQRVAGYALTGLTIERALFFLYGAGANGKEHF
jgi:putative DNA primase/helicase